MGDSVYSIFYILAAAGFILAIKWMNSPVTARRGVIVGEIGMLLAVVGTLMRFEVVNYEWIFIAFLVGSAIGVPIAYMMPMTAVPQRTAVSHACGALASALIGTAEYYRHTPNGFIMTALVLETLLGFLTCTIGGQSLTSCAAGLLGEGNAFALGECMISLCQVPCGGGGEVAAGSGDGGDSGD